MFEKICPDEEFLLPVPNPEDIILDDFLQDPNQNASDTGIGDQGTDEENLDSGEASAEQEQVESADSPDNPLSEEENQSGTGVTPSDLHEHVADD